MATLNPYSDTLLMDALRGSLSNAESFGRGLAVAPVGLLGDLEGLLRKGANFSFGRGGVKVNETPVLPTTESLLAAIPRISNPRMETAGIEQIGAASNPKGPIALGKTVGRMAGREINRAMMGEGGLLGPITPQPMYVVPPGKSIKQMPQSKSLLDMNRTPSEAEIKKAPREDLINWLQNNDPNGTYLDPTPDPAVNMYRTAKGYAIEDANTGSVSEFGDYNKAKQEFDALRFSNSEFQPMTLKEAQESAINYLRESAQPAGGGKLLQFGSKPSGLLD